MSNADEFWDFYWEVRLQGIEDLGKREIILAVSRLIRELSQEAGKAVRLLELGCGEGQIIGPLVNAHTEIPSIQTSLGIDYLSRSIQRCRRDYPGLQFIEGDFTDRALLSRIGKFEIVLLVNALHEVFSTTYSHVLGEVDVPAAKERVVSALAGAASCLLPGGWLALFDGLEPPEASQQMVQIRFRHLQAQKLFEVFAREYHPFQIAYRTFNDPSVVELSMHDFTRYITKSIFLGKPLWQTERLESYQYFTEQEFRTSLARQGFIIRELRKLTVDYEKWDSLVAIETPGVDFPEEHILILAQKQQP